MTSQIPCNQTVPSFHFFTEAYDNYWEDKENYDLVIRKEGEKLTYMLIPNESMDSMFNYGTKQCRKGNKNFSKHLISRTANISSGVSFTSDQIMSYPRFTRYLAGEGF